MEELAQFAALIDCIYQGATDPGAWPMILEAIAGWMAASKGLVFTPQHDPRKDGFVFPYGITPAALESWASVFQPQDLWTIRAAERGLLQEGRVVLDKELATEPELLASAWYRDFLATLDIGRVLSGCIFGPGHAHLPMPACCCSTNMAACPFRTRWHTRSWLLAMGFLCGQRWPVRGTKGCLCRTRSRRAW